MDKKEAINIIEALYPADSQYKDSRETGKALLQQAKEELNNWRNEPPEVLIRYAELCQQKENRETYLLLHNKR
jgi:hypothetical protein